MTKDEAIEAFKVLKIRMSGDDARHVCQLFDLEDSSQYVLLYRLILCFFKFYTSIAPDL